MGALLAVLGIMNSIKAMQAGDKLGGVLGVLGTANQAGWFESTPTYSNSLGDFGVRRNYL